MLNTNKAVKNKVARMHSQRAAGKLQASKSQKGVVLLESLIAILIFSMGILALVGLQGAMVKNTSDAKYRAEATFIAQQLLGQMWLGRSPADVNTDADISTLLPDGTSTVVVSGEGVITVTISWQLPGENLHSYSTNARIEGI